jgi:AGZA family xanthine/uracil permease-like MFS transporter
MSAGTPASALARYFHFAELGTNWRTEILAGSTTFLTMAYIIFVNPAILAETGMPFQAVLIATCLSAAAGSLLMGLYAKYPIALAPGMGLNAYFTYAVVKGMGVPWTSALGAVFLSGILFLILTLTGLRQRIIAAVPRELYAAVAAGIGLFIAFIGLRNAGLVVASPATLVTLGDLRSPLTLLAAAGLLLVAALYARQIRAAVLIGIAVTTLASAALGLTRWNPQPARWDALSATFLQLDIAGTLRLGFVEIVFVFLFVDLFDNVGTLLAVGQRAGLFRAGERIPRLHRILTADALATIAGSLTGTSTVVSYIESAAGVAAGGRSGATAAVTGILFLLAIPVASLLGAIPAAATAPALILVGCLMMAHAAEIDWPDPIAAVPAFLTLILIPLTFSIANGLAVGFLAHVALTLAAGRWKRLHPVTVLMALLFLVRFAYLAAG